MVPKKDLALQNKILQQKIKDVEDRIKALESQQTEDLLSDEDELPAGVDWISQRSGVGRQEVQSLRDRISATEQLLGITSMSLETRLLPQDPSNPGHWQEVCANIILENFLKVALTFVEHAQDEARPVHWLQCAVAGRLARHETGSLLEVCCAARDVPLLLSGLREYARLYVDRKDVLDSFAAKYGAYFSSATTEEGYVLEWRDSAFRVTWGISYDVDIARVLNQLQVDVHPGIPGFLKACSPSLARLSEPSAVAEDRLSMLADLAARALLL